MMKEGIEFQIIVLVWTTLVAPALLAILNWWLRKH